MSSGAQLLGRIARESSAPGPLLVPLRTLFGGFARAFWEDEIPVVPLRLTPDHCRVIGPGQITHYQVTADEGWAAYADIRSAFSDRNQERARGASTRGAKTSPLPPALVDAPVKLVIRDQDNPLRCAVVW